MYTQSDLQSQTVYAFGGQQRAFTLTQNADGLNSTATLISGLTAQKTYDTLELKNDIRRRSTVKKLAEQEQSELVIDLRK